MVPSPGHRCSSLTRDYHAHEPDYALAENGHGFGNAGRDMRVSQVQTDTDIVKVPHLKNGDQMLGCGGIARSGFQPAL